MIIRLHQYASMHFYAFVIFIEVGLSILIIHLRTLKTPQNGRFQREKV